MLKIKQINPLSLYYLGVFIPVKAMDIESKSVLIGNDFLSIHQVSQTLLKICPPQRCIIVGVGQSPTPFMAYLQDEADNYAYALPLSNFRYGFHNDPLDAEDTLWLYHHFDQFLPEPAELKNRSVMLLDIASQSGGITIMSVARYIESDRMLDHYLMPDLFFNGTNSSALEEQILNRFSELLKDPEAKTLALGKLSEYTNEKTSLPRITDETNSRKVPARTDFHNSFRNSLFKKIGILISTHDDEK